MESFEVYEGLIERLLMENMAAMLPSMVMNALGGLVGLAVYVMTSIALYSIARRRELNHPWMAWVPVLNLWLLGSVSDQYQYVTRHENKAKRKVLLVLSILSVVVFAGICAVAVGMVKTLIPMAVEFTASFRVDEEALIRAVGTPVLAVMGLSLPLMGLSIAKTVVRYMALYDVFASCEPRNKTLYLVLSIVGAVFLRNLLEPIFLLVVKNKDEGMPPRRVNPEYSIPGGYPPQYQAPQYQAPQYQPPQYQTPQYQAPQYQPPQYQQTQYPAAPQYQSAAQPQPQSQETQPLVPYPDPVPYRTHQPWQSHNDPEASIRWDSGK